MRGKAAWSRRRADDTRITPAHAGKRSIGTQTCFLTWDHPRPCGEKLYAARLIVVVGGSPPPMRGKGRFGVWHPVELRITPAHAGKSESVYKHFKQYKDHPRPCGEKVNKHRRARHTVGSPPPMRGKDRHRGWQVDVAGITPAHAGKRLRKRRNTGIFVFQISRFHSVSHTPDTSYGNRPALYVRRLHRTPAALQASKAYDRARWAAYAWLFAVCPHTGS